MAGRKSASEGGATTAPLDERVARERTLVIIGGDRDRAVPLPATGSLVIGRAAECDVVIADPSVSRRHVRLHLAPLACEDLGASNPARVRGRRLAARERIELAAGETIAIGRSLVLVRGDGDDWRAAAGRGRAVGPDLVCVDPAMQRIYELVERIAIGQVPVLILGETGVGKEVIAAAVHRRSPRAGEPLVKLNCAALPPTLLESELFGHERGAFTGAERRRAGLLETADGGTVFLDEIGDLQPGLQAALLRVLEERAVWPIGAREPRPIDVRWIAATNRDLRAEIERGAFRRDLYYRLNGVSFHVPALRERRDEVLPLALRFAAVARGAPVAIAPDAEAALVAHAWPGNVRELRHAIESAALLAGAGRIELAHLPDEVRRPDGAAAPALSAGEPARPERRLRDEMAGVERRRIIDALRATGGNQTHAAERLGMPRRTLVKRLREYGISRGRKLPDE